MGFLAPWFLGGLALLGLPVWLHLLRQHRTRPKQFSSLMFFEPRTESSIKHRRLKYLLLLAARLLLLLLVVLAFAAPYVNRKGPLAAAGRKLVVLALDRSYSMRVGDRLSRAKAEALRVLAQRNPRDPVQVLSMATAVTSLTQPVTETAPLRAAVESINASDSRGSFGELARALRSIAQSAGMPVEAHLFSDMQKSGLPPVFKDLDMGSSVRLILHDVGAETTPNWAVESVTAPRSVFDPKKARVQAIVAGYHTPAAKRTLTLFVNGKVSGSKVVEIPESGRASAEFIGFEANYGFNRAEVRIDGADALKGDDVFFFAVERADPRRILFVHEARGQRALLYFRSALEAASEGAFLLDAVTPERSSSVTPGQYAVIVLNDVVALPPSFEQALKNYVRAGGAVFVAAGPASASGSRLPVFDEAVRESRYASRAGERFLMAGSMEMTHPVLRATGRWENVKFYQVLRIEPGQARVLVRLSDDLPLLLEKRLGEGRMLALASTLDNISNDFPLHPSFVPFIEQSMRYLIGSEVRPSSYTVDSHVELRAEKGAGTVEVLDPRGGRALGLKEAANAQSFLLTEVGFYDIARANSRHELVAVNADRKESDLEKAPAETLALWQGAGLEGEHKGGGAQAGEQEQEQRAALWWYVLGVALAVALAESLLAGRYLGMEQSEG